MLKAFDKERFIVYNIYYYLCFTYLRVKRLCGGGAVGKRTFIMKKKKRSIVWLILTVLITAFLGFVEINGMPLWTPIEIVPMVDEIDLGLDLRGGMRVVYEADVSGAENVSSALDSAEQVLRTRLDSAGYTEATITRQGGNQIVVEVPGVSGADELSEVLMKPAVLQFRAPDDDSTVLLTGDDVKSATAYSTTDSYGSIEYVVSLEFTSEGTEKFKEATTTYLNQQISIYLDDTMISSPTVNAVISDGSAIISGMETLADAQELAGLIQSGALPVPLTEIAVKNVGATLGAGSLEKTILAGVIAFAIILLFMLAIYRIPGLMADIALCVYMVLMIIALYIFNVTLTLPGIAGIILSLGMAVDANVVIFERIKEEIKYGRSLSNAVEKGFKNAFTAVLDANITTLIAVVVLAIFGTGTVQGFAVTLGIGIVLALLTEVVFVHLFLKWMINIGIKNPRAYGVKMEDSADA